MNFWNELSTALAQSGFLPDEIKRLRKRFNTQKINEILRTSPNVIMQDVDGSMFERTRKSQVFLAVVQKISARLENEPAQPTRNGETTLTARNFIDTFLGTYHSALKEAGVTSFAALRVVAHSENELNRLGIDRISQRHLLSFATIARFFPPDISSFLQDAGASSLGAVTKLSKKEFINVMRANGVAARRAAFEHTRLQQLTQSLDEGADIRHIMGLDLDLTPAHIKELVGSHRSILADAGVETLVDWATVRRTLSLPEAVAEGLDAYARLYAVQINGERAAKFIREGFRGAYSVAQIDGEQTARLSNSLQEPSVTFYTAISQAQQTVQSIRNHLLSTQTARDAEFPNWLKSRQLPALVGVVNACIPCSEETSIFSCFAYIVELIQLTDQTLEKLSKKLKIDLTNLSAASVLEPAPELENACEKMTVCTQVTRLLQDYLDQLRNAAADRDEADAYSYLPYATWRATKMAEYYLELNALWRDDIFTGETGPSDRGSFIFHHSLNRQKIKEGLELARQSIDIAKAYQNSDRFPASISPNTYSNAPRFKTAHPLYYADFNKGLDVIEKVVEADRLIQEEALKFSDQEQSGLALDVLYKAYSILEEMASLVFERTSPWIALHEFEQEPYDRLLRALPAQRKDHLEALCIDLTEGNKQLFTPRNLREKILGLSPSGEVDLTQTTWNIGSGFSNVGGKIIKSNDSSAEESLVYYKGDGSNNFNNFINPALTADLTLRESSNDSLPYYLSTTGYIAGLAIHLPSNSGDSPVRGYRLAIEQTISSNDNDGVLDDILDFIFGEDEVITRTQVLVLEKIVEEPNGSSRYEELDSARIGFLSDAGSGGEALNPVDAYSRLLETDRSYTLSLHISGNSIVGKLTGFQGREPLEVYSSESSIYSNGTFGFYAGQRSRLEFSNIQFRIESGNRSSYPPFHANRRTDNRHRLEKSLYILHRDLGRGMAQTDLVDQPLTNITAQRTTTLLHGLSATDNQDNLFLLFDEGQPTIPLGRWDTLLEKCLVAAFYLRYAVIPVRLAQVYFLQGEYERAASYLHLVYDDSASVKDEEARAIYPFLASAPEAFTSTVGADAKLMRLRLGEIYLAWAERLFRQDTFATRYQAGKLFNRVLRLYERFPNCNCESGLGITVETVLMRQVLSRVDELKNPGAFENLTNVLEDMFSFPPRAVDYQTIFQKNLSKSGSLLSSDSSDESTSIPNTLASIRNDIASVEGAYKQGLSERTCLGNLQKHGQTLFTEAELALLAQTNLLNKGKALNRTRLPRLKSYIYPRIYEHISYLFCIPSSPLKNQQKQQACLMLDLLKSCRNILGFTNDLIPPVRFEALLRVAKNFTDSAHASERDLLSFRKEVEAENYSLIQAANSLTLNEADVGLEAMNVSLVQGDIELANLQAVQILDKRDYFQGLVDGGLSNMETLALASAWGSTAFYGLSAAGGALSAISTAVGIGTSAAGNSAGPPLAGLGAVGTLLGGASGVATFLGSVSSSAGLQASFERREQEWTFNRAQSEAELAIAQQSLNQTVARYATAQRRYQIAALRRDLTANALRYLESKFLNAAMLNWLQRMSREQYQTRLNYAITAAFMAERALAFELQNKALRTIRFDYFDPRRDGLLGATQLQTDLDSLENTRLAYTQRRLQLSKTLSLAKIMPAELQRFKQTGWLVFNTLMQWFDHETPGHYMRLIKKISITTIALIPPNDGIRATLTNSGISQVVLGPPYSNDFETQNIRRNPESVSLSSPFQATGLFELSYESDLLLPFEGSGVATDWIFELPKAANQFDYRTIADVLVTIEYTALYSTIYRQKVIDQLDNTASAERPYSFRNQFADAWYDLNNPDQTDTPMIVSLLTRQEDFLPNLSDLIIEQVTLYFVRKDEFTDEIPVQHLLFTETGNANSIGGSAQSADGIISTRRGNANNWDIFIGKTPFGRWELSFVDEPNSSLPSGLRIRNLFEEELIEDILFVITYSGKRPPFAQ